ncbi:MAG: hypothetical protein WCD18_07665 [Thermosynechococcaceae cyanobacterium]
MFTSRSILLKTIHILTSGVPFIVAVNTPVIAETNQINFKLYPNKPFVACMAASAKVTPTVDAVVKRGGLNDTLTLTLRNFKPGLKFDLFTIQRSNQLANGKPDPKFKNFGLAWYQSDVEANKSVAIKTILLDQIFGFDPDVALDPTQTLHVGFWFNNPADVEPCGFAGPPTPFNGEHKAGPVAFITRPNAATKLGPLCTNPNLKTRPATCNP